ncbi:P-loop NTPase fold protein [Geodermatophilus sp. SYSU D00691]
MTAATIAPPYVGHILLDVPAANPTLGYDRIAEALAAIVQNSEPRFAVGIFGSWGSGKSTLMESLAARIDRDRAVVVPFNAWQYEREPHIVLPLLDTIRACLTAWADAHPQERGPAENIARRIGRVVRALARGLSVQVGVPGAMTIGVDADRVLETLKAGTADEPASPQSVYYAAFSELQAAFELVEASQFTRIVVFVDDLDRCLPASALSVIESMKLFFDLPGFVFVVGMDPRVIERAVRVKFQEEFPTDGGDEAAAVRKPERDYAKQLERDYVKKIIQVQCSLPEMAPAQLGELLDWVIYNVQLSEEQKRDLEEGGRVRRYLVHVAAEGRVNPRQVKRFVNAYTLQRMVQDDLDPEALLALQVLEFRPDWETVRDVLLAEPDVFLAALKVYRGDGPEPSDDHALENLWPHLAVLPAELSAFLRSEDVAPLVLNEGQIDRYLSSLGSTSSIPDWLRQAFRNVGQLRQQIRELGPDVRWGSARARDAAERMKALRERIAGYGADNPEVRDRVNGPLERIQEAIEVLSPSGATQPHDVSPEEFAAWRQKVMGAIDKLQEEFRLLRRSISPPTP